MLAANPRIRDLALTTNGVLFAEQAEDLRAAGLHRVTLSLEVLNAAQTLVLLATGAGKAQALARALGRPDPDVPASLLDATRLTVIADAAALAQT